MSGSNNAFLKVPFGPRKRRVLSISFSLSVFRILISLSCPQHFLCVFIFLCEGLVSSLIRFPQKHNETTEGHEISFDGCLMEGNHLQPDASLSNFQIVIGISSLKIYCYFICYILNELLYFCHHYQNSSIFSMLFS